MSRSCTIDACWWASQADCEKAWRWHGVPPSQRWSHLVVLYLKKTFSRCLEELSTTASASQIEMTALDSLHMRIPLETPNLELAATQWRPSAHLRTTAVAPLCDVHLGSHPRARKAEIWEESGMGPSDCEARSLHRGRSSPVPHRNCWWVWTASKTAYLVNSGCSSATVQTKIAPSTHGRCGL